MEEEKGKWEEIIRSKIFDFEEDTHPEDWIALSAKLEGGKVVRFNFYRKLTFAISAAAVILLLIIGGLYLFTNKDDVSGSLADVEKPFQQNTEKKTDAADNVINTTETPVDNFVDKPVDQLIAVTSTPERRIVSTQSDEVKATAEVTTTFLIDETVPAPITDDTQPVKDNAPEKFQEINASDKIHLADASTAPKRRRWGFGMGGGGYAVGSSSDMTLSSSSGLLKEDEFMFDGDVIHLRSGAQTSSWYDPVEGFDNSKSPLGKVKHKRPISAGLGISYFLTDRWTLHSGFVYTLLRSKGNYLDVSDWKQNLHFIGIPLSASYTIADWNRIRFYVSAGGMGELNIAGKRINTIRVDNLEVIENEKIRMKEPLWSVNSRVGAVYPLWKFIYFYGEAGVSYYFNNNSYIETIRSEKPFNESFQVGIRLGF